MSLQMEFSNINELIIIKKSSFKRELKRKKSSPESSMGKYVTNYINYVTD